VALNGREKLFADEYIKLGNAYQAALNAGYKESTAKEASKWINPETLKNPNEKERKKYKPEVREFIDKRMAEKESKLIADQDEVLKYLTSVLRGESQSSVLARNFEGGEDVIEKPPDEKERLKAAELLGKRYGLYTEKVEQAVDMELNITVDYGEDE
jgi:phage terminase small subunit